MLFMVEAIHDPACEIRGPVGFQMKI